MDVDWLYYMYTTVLGKTEEDFWKSTPRKIFSQLECYKEAHRKKNSRNISNNRTGSHITQETKVLKCLD